VLATDLAMSFVVLDRGEEGGKVRWSRSISFPFLSSLPFPFSFPPVLLPFREWRRFGAYLRSTPPIHVPHWNLPGADTSLSFLFFFLFFFFFFFSFLFSSKSIRERRLEEPFQQSKRRPGPPPFFSSFSPLPPSTSLASYAWLAGRHWGPPCMKRSRFAGHGRDSAAPLSLSPSPFLFSSPYFLLFHQPGSNGRIRFSERVRYRT